MTGQEQSDDPILMAQRKTGRSESKPDQGKKITVSKVVLQHDLFGASVETSQEAVGSLVRDLSRANERAVRKASYGDSNVLPALSLESIACIENLEIALHEVVSKKGAPGIDKQTVQDVKLHEHRIIAELSQSLLNESYKPGDIRRVWIPKSCGGQRGLGIPNIVDRIVQQAVLRVLNPHYDSTFHENCHGFRKGRGCHSAINQAKAYIEDGYEWVVDIDLEKFFDTVNHDRLMTRLELRVKDKRIHRIIRQMLRANVIMPDGVKTANEEGTPQGGPLSPLLSNIVLDEMDTEFAKRGYRFVRYADDCNIYVRSERAGLRTMASITRFIEKKLKLKVNSAKSAVARPHERHFLGVRLQMRASSENADVLLSARSLKNIKAKIVALTPRNYGSAFDTCVQRLNRYLKGWISYFSICTTYERNTLSKLDAHIRRRLRCLQLRHWKRKRTIVRRLIDLGVDAKTAWTGVYKHNRSWWSLSHKICVERGLSNLYLQQQGLVSLVDTWSLMRPKHVVSPQLKLFG